MGIRVIQAGNRQQSGISSEGKVIREKFRHLGEMNDLGMVYLIRNYDFEPWLFPQNLDVYLDEIDVYVQRGEPVVISSHSVNYISSIKDFRSVSLPILDDLLSALVSKYNHLYFLNSAQLGQAISEGFFITSDGQTVELKQRKSFYHDLKSTLIHILYKIKHKL